MQVAVPLACVYWHRVDSLNCIEWLPRLNTPLFELGRTYTRQQIYTILGGDLVSNFPQQQGRIAYCCLNQSVHREAPEMILIEKQGRAPTIARKFAEQSEAVPLFLKQNKDNNFIYQGLYVVERYSDDHAELARLSKMIYASNVACVLFLKQIIH